MSNLYNFKIHLNNGPESMGTFESFADAFNVLKSLDLSVKETNAFIDSGNFGNKTIIDFEFSTSYIIAELQGTPPEHPLIAEIKNSVKLKYKPY
jgi:hypothetical protein